MKKHIIWACAGALLISGQAMAQKKKDKEQPAAWTSATFSGLKFRSIGPAVVSGRVVDIAVNPQNSSEYYIAAAAGGVWKTNNAGTTFDPVFEQQASFSIGCIRIDPNNPNIVWVGSGENNNQRSVSYGDGIYKSEDAGRTWKNMGLKNSEHIGMIAIDPHNSNVVYVAAYGPLWSAGGDRGIYKTTDGGNTWKQVLSVSENTGFNEIHMDPRNPDILYATSHQRRRHVWTYISGGPESAVYKSTDGGATWNKLTTGIPSVDKGRMSLAISPVNPDIVYLMIEGGADVGGVYRSEDRGASFKKMSGYNTAGNYYVEIIPDPFNADRLYSMDTWLQVSSDGGKTWKKLGERHKHVDNHVIWVDPRNAKHYLVGCDGGVYESWDAAANWQFKANLPITQFYKVDVDNDMPFYHIYGGTQDNNSLGGPSRTTSATGITNADWFVTTGGDGFETQVDPTNPNLVYAQSQYGGLVRYDRKSGEAIDIRPVEAANSKAYRWNWDAPLAISRFDSKRLYFGANVLFRTDDRGNTWKVISPDLSRQIDRNRLPVMGKVWGMDAVAKNQSTSVYGNIVAFAESPLDENLLFVGTDDGLVQITTDGGKNWKKVAEFPGVPTQTYVNAIWASQYDKNTLYVAFNNHKNGDFKPYLLKSTDLGKTWKPIQSNLPGRGSVYSIAEDFADKDLLFAGTEYGLFFTKDGGGSWTQLKGGLPTIAIRDIAIQRRENDLILATFGRGFYVLDNYAPLRNISKETFDKPAYIFPVKDALMYVEAYPYNHKGKAFQGESFYTAENPPVGTVITYFMKSSLETLREKRQQNEAELLKKNLPVYYPSLDSIRMEDREEEPYLLFTIKDDQGSVVRRIKTDGSQGLKRITWDFRYAPSSPVSFDAVDPDNVYASEPTGPLALPGKYTVSMAKVEDGKLTELAGPVEFNVLPLSNGSIPVADRATLEKYYFKVASLQRAVTGANQYLYEMKDRTRYLRAAVLSAPSADVTLLSALTRIDSTLGSLDMQMNGDRSAARREFETLPGLTSRVDNIVYSLWNSTQEATSTFKESYDVVADQFGPILQKLKEVDGQMSAIENKLESAGAPYTPGRLPDWKKQ